MQLSTLSLRNIMVKATQHRLSERMVNKMAGHPLRRQNGIVAGVCGGLAEFFGINVFWFRLLFLILLIPGGLPGLLPYFILWLVIPHQ